MQDFETEEQQVEAIKKWFSENALSLFLGVGIGVAGLFGWRYYIEQQATHQAEASEMYQSVQKNITDTIAADNVTETVNELVAEYQDTPYATLASLTKARHEFETSNIESALSRLDWASEHASENELRHLAGLRQARVLISQEKYQAAEQLLSQQYPQSFNVLYAETKGDLYVAMGDKDRARTAYDSAIESAGMNVDPWLTLKRQQLGEPGITRQDDSEPTAQ